METMMYVIAFLMAAKTIWVLWEVVKDIRDGE
jgi:hypothetical protein